MMEYLKREDWFAHKNLGNEGTRKKINLSKHIKRASLQSTQNEQSKTMINKRQKRKQDKRKGKKNIEDDKHEIIDWEK